MVQGSGSEMCINSVHDNMLWASLEHAIVHSQNHSDSSILFDIQFLCLSGNLLEAEAHGDGDGRGLSTGTAAIATRVSVAGGVTPVHGVESIFCRLY